MNRPLVLAFDCSGAACAVAVAAGQSTAPATILARRTQAMQRGHAAALAPMIEATLKDASVAPGALDLITVTVGPGSFTGVRIGLAMARGLALALRIPLAGLTTIDVLLAGATDADHQRVAVSRGRLVAAIDTHRGDYYAGFDDALTPFVGNAADIARRASSRALVVLGDGAGTLCQALKPLGIHAEPGTGSVTPDPVTLATVALQHNVDHWRVRNDSDGMPRPLYLRVADVTLAKGSG